jgi:hypothetical protein
MVTVAAGFTPEDGASQQALPPHGHQPPGIEILRMN